MCLKKYCTDYAQIYLVDSQMEIKQFKLFYVIFNFQ